VTLLIIRLPGWVRLVAGAALQIGYQLLLDFSRGSIGYETVGSGILWSLSWSAMLILATVLADLFHEPRYGRKACLEEPALRLLWISRVVLDPRERGLGNQQAMS